MNKGVVIQILSCLIVCTGNYFVGYSIAWVTYALEALDSDHSPLGIRITKMETNLLGALPMAGMFVASIFWWILDYLGRKKTLILTALMFMLSWSLVTAGTSILQLLIGRFVLGLASGLHCIVVLTFVSECVHNSYIGTAMSFMSLTYCLGILVAYALGCLCSYQVVNYINLTHSVLFVIMIFWLKETPAYLLTKGKELEAKESLKFYRGVKKSTQDIVNELNYLRSQSVTTKGSDDTEKGSNEPEKEKLRQEEITQSTKEEMPIKVLFKSPSARRALIISTLHIVLLVFCGTIAVTAYADQLFIAAAPGLSSNVCSMVLAIAFAVGAVLATWLSDRLKRRTLMLASGAVSSICLAVLWSLLRWQWAPQWAAPAAVLLYCCSFQCGVANIPFIQLSEVFPSRLKSITTMIASSFMCIGNFVVLAFFGPMVDMFGLDGTFLTFSFICGITTVSAFFLMRETKDVPFAVIEKMFAKGFLYRRKMDY